MADIDTIITRLEGMGIDYERLTKCLDSKDNWGDLVHSFEYLTVLGVVREAWNDIERDKHNREIRTGRAS